MKIFYICAGVIVLALIGSFIVSRNNSAPIKTLPSTNDKTVNATEPSLTVAKAKFEYPSELGDPHVKKVGDLYVVQFFPSKMVNEHSLEISISADELKSGETIENVSADYVAPNIARHALIVDGRAAFCQWISDSAPVTLCVAQRNDNLLLVTIFGDQNTESSKSARAAFRLMELNIERSIQFEI
jgi:hypothetical protein